MNGRALLAALLLLMLQCTAQAQFVSTDAPYVPTPPNVIDAMFDIALVNTNDYLIDLGSGDGRLPIAAAKKYGIVAMGVELDASLVTRANEEAKRQGVSGKVSFVQGNLLKIDFSRASVLTLYLSRQINLQVRPRILSELRPGTRVISHDFDMGNWSADQRREVSVPDKPYGAPVSHVYLWYVPASVAGKWRWQLTIAGESRVYEVVLDQQFQNVDTSALVDGGTAQVRAMRLRGDIISFTLTREIYGRQISHEFNGRVEGDRMVGQVRVSGGGQDETADWVATRVERGRMRID